MIVGTTRIGKNNMFKVTLFIVCKGYLDSLHDCLSFFSNTPADFPRNCFAQQRGASGCPDSWSRVLHPKILKIIRTCFRKSEVVHICRVWNKQKMRMQTLRHYVHWMSHGMGWLKCQIIKYLINLSCYLTICPHFLARWRVVQRT